jgi:hypothetical protein
MNRMLLSLLLVSSVAYSAFAQPKPAGGARPSSSAAKKPGKGAKVNPQDTVWRNPADTIDWNDYDIRFERRFAVYTKRQGGKDKRLRLCVNLPRDTMLNFCMVDSLCRDPERYKVLFETKDADTTYILLFVEAFSKPVAKPSCDAGRETKLLFFRWSTSTNKALVRQRNISSCMRGIEPMGKVSAYDWKGDEPLVVEYYKPGSNFVSLKFDPQQYKLGFQSAGDEGK